MSSVCFLPFLLISFYLFDKLKLFLKNKCYEVSHFVILSSLLSPLHQGFLLSNLWPTSQINFIVLWNMIHSKGFGISQRDLLICCTLTDKPGTTPDSLQETTIPFTTSERILAEFSGEKRIFYVRSL